jgi:hypothetical protein
MHANFSMNAQVAIACFAQNPVIAASFARMGASNALPSNPRQLAAVTLSELRDQMLALFGA